MSNDMIDCSNHGVISRHQPKANDSLHCCQPQVYHSNLVLLVGEAFALAQEGKLRF